MNEKKYPIKFCHDISRPYERLKLVYKLLKLFHIPFYHAGYFCTTLLPNVYLINLQYCKFGNFHKNFIFTNYSIKRHIGDVKNSQLRQDLPISTNDRVILPFPEGFIFFVLGK